jgi:hypothetical protein
MDIFRFNEMKICPLEMRLVEGRLEFPSSAASSANYFIPQQTEEVDLIRQWLHSLENGKILSCRGRDPIREEDGTVSSFTNWDLGYAVKMNRRVFLLWDTEVESVMIDGCNFLDQLHFEYHLEDPIPVSLPPSDRVVMICHGFCFEHGPNYLFLSALSSALRAAGYRVIIPDFRPRYFFLQEILPSDLCCSYKYGPTRGRSERIRIVMDEIVYCMGEVARNRRDQSTEPSDLNFVLVGHSQGGAAISQVRPTVLVQ